MNRLISIAALATLGLGLAAFVSETMSPAQAIGRSADNPGRTAAARGQSTYSPEEIKSAGHNFFGNTTKGLAQAVEHVFAQAGRPSGYIIGEEASGAFLGGLRYGEGTLYIKNGGSQKVFWQGPSVGFDVGGNGSRTLVLIYNIGSPEEIFDRFVGVEGTAYVIGGLGVNFQSNERLKLAPIRTGVGARLGANVGYLKYTASPTWNPF